MNTATAALQAHVTTATIRAWARRGVIAATKTAGRWIINAASLAHRIAIAALKTRKATAMTDIPIQITTDTNRGTFGVSGPADVLRAAFEAGTPVTLTGQYEGERVYLGNTFRDWRGAALTTIGLDREENGIAVYLISEDADRLGDAPKVMKAIDDEMDRVYAAEATANRADDGYLNNYYE